MKVISVRPEKMEGGKITAINVSNGEKEDVFLIPPAPFEGFEEIQRIIRTYYELRGMWREAIQAEEAAKQRLALVDDKYQIALRDFNLLVTPTKVKAPEIVVVNKPSPAQELASREDLKLEDHVEAPPVIKILPPENPTEAALNAAIEAQTIAEQNQTELIASQEQQAEASKPSITGGLIIDQSKGGNELENLPPKAKAIVKQIAGGMNTQGSIIDKITPERSQPEPKTNAEWCTEIQARVAERLAGQEFDMETLKNKVSDCGVPKEKTEEVAGLIIAAWEQEGQFEHKKNSVLLFLNSIPEKVGIKKKKPSGGKKKEAK